jgi:hypothetical protein
MEPGSISSEVVRGDLLAAYGKMSPGWGPGIFGSWECNESKITGFRVLLVLAGI